MLWTSNHIGKWREIGFQYERLPNLCYWCGRRLAHDDKQCELWIRNRGSLKERTKAIPKQPSTAELEGVAETEVFINHKSSNPDFILLNNPGLTFDENQSLSQPAGSDECTRSFTSGVTFLIQTPSHT